MEKYNRRIKGLDLSMGDVGRIESIKDGIVRIKGLANVKANEMLRIGGGIYCLVFNYIKMRFFLKQLNFKKNPKKQNIYFLFIVSLALVNIETICLKSIYYDKATCTLKKSVVSFNSYKLSHTGVYSLPYFVSLNNSYNIKGFKRCFSNISLEEDVHNILKDENIKIEIFFDISWLILFITSQEQDPDVNYVPSPSQIDNFLLDFQRGINYRITDLQKGDNQEILTKLNVGPWLEEGNYKLIWNSKDKKQDKDSLNNWNFIFTYLIKPVNRAWYYALEITLYELEEFKDNNNKLIIDFDLKVWTVLNFWVNSDYPIKKIFNIYIDKLSQDKNMIKIEEQYTDEEQHKLYLYKLLLDKKEKEKNKKINKAEAINIQLEIFIEKSNLITFFSKSKHKEDKILIKDLWKKYIKVEALDLEKKKKVKLDTSFYVNLVSIKDKNVVTCIWHLPDFVVDISQKWYLNTVLIIKPKNREWAYLIDINFFEPNINLNKLEPYYNIEIWTAYNRALRPWQSPEKKFDIINIDNIFNNKIIIKEENLLLEKKEEKERKRKKENKNGKI